MSLMNILRWKRLPRPLLLEEIIGVLEEHRHGGNIFTADGNFVVCRCGRRFPDNQRFDANRLLRQHMAEEVAKLQCVEHAGPNLRTFA
jgi:hypothetical protein